MPAGTKQLHLDWMRHDGALPPLHDHPRYQALVRYLEDGSQKSADGSQRVE